MRVITEPTVTLLAWPQFREHPRYKLPRYRNQGPPATSRPQGTACEQLTAHAGKGCYDSYGEDGRDIDKHIQNLIESGHGSVLEHANVSLFIEGISRGCSHEVVRHRAGFAFSQRSTRYTAEDDAAMVLEPFYAETWLKIHAAKELPYAQAELQLDVPTAARALRLGRIMSHFQEALKIYRDETEALLLDAPVEMTKHEKRKWARGKARQMLPHALETRMTMTGNLRAWRHFLEARSHPAAEPEIRRLAHATYRVLQALAPTVFQDYERAPTENGYPNFGATKNRKV